jgi:thiol-disulfide isomerase/thioredoxin
MSSRLLSPRFGILAALVAVAFLLAPGARARALLRAGERAPALSFRSGSRLLNLRAWRGKKVLLWVFSTWCPSCRVGLHALARKEAVLRADRLSLVVLENYGDGGYQGPALGTVVARHAPAMTRAPNWTFGHATRAFANVYNPRSYPDVFYLIRPDGTIARVSSAPGAHLGMILRFARGGKP